MSSHRCQSATAEDGAEHLTIMDVDRHIAANDTGCQGFLAEATSAAENVTICT